MQLIILLVSLLSLLSGCAIETPKLEIMSIADARDVEANFNLSQFKNLPRDISQIQAEMGHGGPIPIDCIARQHREEMTLEEKLRRAQSAPTGDIFYGGDYANFEKNGAVLALISSIRHAEISGDFKLALELTSKAISIAPITAKRYGGARSILQSKKAVLLAKTGQLNSAKDAMNDFSSSARWVSNEGGIPWIESVTRQVFVHTGLAAIAFAEGKLSVAEQHYRIALKNLEFNRYPQRFIDLYEVKTELASILLQQGRLTEAESAARDAINKIGLSSALAYANWPPPKDGNAKKKIHEIPEYSGLNAGPFTLLALVFMEQGRLEDAEYLARIAVNMHEAGCSSPDSLGFNRARSAFLRVLAQQQKWPEIMAQIKQIKISLHKPWLFEHLYGESLDVAEAEINSGDIIYGQAILDKRLQALNAEDDTGSAYESAIIQGLEALALKKQGKHSEAINLFQSVFSDLTQSIPSGSDTNLEGRKKRILSGYAVLLHNTYESEPESVLDINIAAELFRVLNASNTSQVQNALFATRIRSTTADPDLVDLIRQQQDLEQEAHTIAEILVRLTYATDLGSDEVTPLKFERRLQNIKSASQVLSQEIKNRFPQYAELTQPHPISVGEASSYLRNGQALMVYQSKGDAVYAWALLPNGQLQFKILDLKDHELRQMVKQLRRSVDPETIDAIKDIPEFDLRLAHKLYKDLLNPFIDVLAAVNELLIVPGKTLASLPFSMLISSEPKAIDGFDLLFEKYRHIDWLVKKFSVVQLPTVNTLTEINFLKAQVKKPDAKAFVGFADPFFSVEDKIQPKIQLAKARGPRALLRGLLPVNKGTVSANNSGIDISILPRLPDTRDEILSVAKALGADRDRDLFVGERASEANVKNTDLASYRAISFATHGLIPGDLNGLHQPALALTNPEISGDLENDGLLTATEILGLKLSADIAVLSACNTAAGEGQGAEAISGLGRSFFYAGAKSILVSNWPVHSEATTELMSYMFSQLAANNDLQRSEALRMTQAKMIDDLSYTVSGKIAFSYAHPIFWAPFTLVGDGG